MRLQFQTKENSGMDRKIVTLGGTLKKWAPVGYGPIFNKGTWWDRAWANNAGLEQLLDRKSILVRVRWAQDSSLVFTTASENFQAEGRGPQKLFVLSLFQLGLQTPASLRTPASISPSIPWGSSHMLAGVLGFQTYFRWPLSSSPFWILASYNLVSKGSDVMTPTATEWGRLWSSVTLGLINLMVSFVAAESCFQNGDFTDALTHIKSSLGAQTVKHLPAMQKTWVLSQGWEDPPGERNGYPLQYSCLENSMHRGAWYATVHGAAKSQTTEWQWTHTHTHTHTSKINKCKKSTLTGLMNNTKKIVAHLS